MKMDAKDALTEEQIANWRKALCATIGPYALLMPAEQIQRIRDRMQERVTDKPKEGKSDE
ncbi:MAG: hypothetical protein V2A73_01920 [Pseudomonadota bacterium]